MVIRIAAVDPLTHTHAPRHARTGLYIYIYIYARALLCGFPALIFRQAVPMPDNALCGLSSLGSEADLLSEQGKTNLIMRPDPRLIPRNGVRLLSLCGRSAFVSRSRCDGCKISRLARPESLSACLQIVQMSQKEEEEFFYLFFFGSRPPVRGKSCTLG